MPSKPRADGPREFFILGAYPSAIHIRWHAPDRTRPIRAVAVDTEPEPFWTGHDEAAQIERWRREISFLSSWGRVAPCGRLNGSSGVWVDELVLQPLSTDRAGAWITDCLDNYFASAGAAARLAEDEIVCSMKENGIVVPNHRAHLSENEIVREALQSDAGRLRSELRRASPRIVVTLGNAALRVMSELAVAGKGPRCLSAEGEDYGVPLRGRSGNLTFDWLPLAHPASPAPYQRAHTNWVASRKAAAQHGVVPLDDRPRAAARQ